MEIDELKSELEKDYVMVKRKKWWSFLGGAFAFLIVAGLISYKSSLQALEGKAAKTATKAIQALKTQAENDTKIIKKRLDVSKNLFVKLETIEEKLATLKEKRISIYQPIKYSQSGYPRNGNFVSKGGKLLIFASGTAYTRSKDTMMEINIYLDEHIIGSLQSLSNEGYSHKTLTSDIIVLTGIKPGSHIIEMKLSSTKIFADKNDLSQITVVELPL